MLVCASVLAITDHQSSSSFASVCHHLGDDQGIIKQLSITQTILFLTHSLTNCERKSFLPHVYHSIIVGFSLMIVYQHICIMCVCPCLHVSIYGPNLSISSPILSSQSFSSPTNILSSNFVLSLISCFLSQVIILRVLPNLRNLIRFPVIEE